MLTVEVPLSRCARNWLNRFVQSFIIWFAINTLIQAFVDSWLCLKLWHISQIWSLFTTTITILTHSCFGQCNHLKANFKLYVMFFGYMESFSYNNTLKNVSTTSISIEMNGAILWRLLDSNRFYNISYQGWTPFICVIWMAYWLSWKYMWHFSIFDPHVIHFRLKKCTTFHKYTAAQMSGNASEFLNYNYYGGKFALLLDIQ